MPITFLRRDAQAGFSLVELLVVVLIIGILATLALPRFLGQRESANDTKAKSAIRAAVLAAETLYAQTQSYEDLALTAPNTLRELEPTLTFVGLSAFRATASPTDINGGAGPDEAILCSKSPRQASDVTLFCVRVRSGAATQYLAVKRTGTTWTRPDGLDPGWRTDESGWRI